MILCFSYNKLVPTLEPISGEVEMLLHRAEAASCEKFLTLRLWLMLCLTYTAL